MNKVRVCMLTTKDNPFNPFTDFDKWYMYDQDCGYCSCSYLARIAKFSDELTDIENEQEQERAIDEIIRYDFLNIYRKVVKEMSVEDYLKSRQPMTPSANDL